MARKVKKFGSDDDSRMAKFSAELESKAPALGGDKLSVLKDSDVPKAKVDYGNQSFGAAFAAARRGGDKTFTWKGKSFSTELASNKPAARKTPAAATPASTPAKTSSPPVKPIDNRFVRPEETAAKYAQAASNTSLRAPAVKPTPAPAKKAERPSYETPGRSINPAQRTKLEAAKARGEATWAAAKAKTAAEKEARGWAKGGSIDGCAIRGKTRAKRKK